MALGLAPIGPASAAVSQVLVEQSFRGTSAGDTWVRPAAATNFACLTASSDTGATPIPGCEGTPDSDGSGVLRLTPAINNAVGTVYNTLAAPAAQGLDVTFNAYIYNGSVTPADGLGFILAAADPANPSQPAVQGPLGKGLGYAAFEGRQGVSHGYLGFGLDELGNSTTVKNASCPAVTGNGTNSIAVRGPGDGTDGYCRLAVTTAPGLWQGRPASRPTATGVKIAINPTSGQLTSSSGLTVPAHSWVMAVSPSGGAQTLLSGALPSASDVAAYTPAGWFDPETGLPYQLSFGWSGSTGGANATHEVSDVRVATLNGQLPALSTGISDNGDGKVLAGNKAQFSIVPGVAANGADASEPITSITTFPAGLTPGEVMEPATGYVCNTDAQTVTCVYTPDGAVQAGDDLPAIVIPATVAAAATGWYEVTSKASSTEANPASASHSVQATSFAAAVSPTTATHGATVTVTGSGLPSTTTGTLTATIDGNEICSATLPTVECSGPANSQAGEDRPVTLTYSGDGQFDAQSASTSLSIVRPAVTTTITDNGEGAVLAGNKAHFSFATQLDAETGAVTQPVTLRATFPTGITPSSPASPPSGYECGTEAQIVTCTYTPTGVVAPGASLPILTVPTSVAADVEPGTVSSVVSSTEIAETPASHPFTVNHLGVTATPDSLPSGLKLTATALGLPQSATGTLTFTVDDAALCTATLPSTTCTGPVRKASGANRTVALSYGGDEAFNSQLASTSVNVTKPADRLLPGQRLYSPDTLTSLNGGNSLTVDPTFALTCPQRVTWTGNAAAGGLIMQEDGNLVLYNAAGKPSFSTGTNGHPNSYVVLQNDGNFVIYDSTAKAIWSSDTFCERLIENPATGRADQLKPNETLWSKDGSTKLVMQTDGNLVLLTKANKVLWNTVTVGNPGARFVVQTDGNLVVYSAAGKALWNAGTKGKIVGKGQLIAGTSMLSYRGSNGEVWKAPNS